MFSRVLICVVFLTTAIFGTAIAQWPLDCQSQTYPGGTYLESIELYSSVPHERLFILDSTEIRIYSYNYCNPVVEATFQLPAQEQNADYIDIHSTNRDLNNDGRYEVFLRSNVSWDWAAFKILDIVGGTVFYDSGIIQGTRFDFYGIDDYDLDGILECLVNVSNSQNGSWHYELRNTGISASVMEGQAATPKAFSLQQNYPNPFNPTTRIEYSLTSPGHVDLDIFNSMGQKVDRLVNQRQEPGVHAVNWNSAAARHLPSGTYFYQLNLDGKPLGARKMILLK